MKDGLKGLIYLGLRALMYRRINHELWQNKDNCQKKNIAKDKMMREKGRKRDIKHPTKRGNGNEGKTIESVIKFRERERL